MPAAIAFLTSGPTPSALIAAMTIASYLLAMQLSN